VGVGEAPPTETRPGEVRGVTGRGSGSADRDSSAALDEHESEGVDVGGGAAVAFELFRCEV
jgi:hypothetical protein